MKRVERLRVSPSLENRREIMPEVNADFTGVYIPGDYKSGDYTFEVKEVKTDTGPSGVYLRVVLQFMDGEYAGRENEEIVSLAQKALWRAKLFLQAVGYEVPDGPLRFRTEDLIGLKFRAHCEREEDKEGKYRPKLRVAEYLDMEPSGSGPETPAQDAPPAEGEAAAPAKEAEKPAEPSAPVARPKVKV
jgi:hypothetical protein